MAALEGLLEIRIGKGVVGKWTPAWCALRGTSLEHFAVEDGSKRGPEPQQVFNLFEVGGLEFDSAKGEISFNAGKTRLRWQSDSGSAQKWFQAMQLAVDPGMTNLAPQEPVTQVKAKQARFDEARRQSQGSDTTGPSAAPSNAQNATPATEARFEPPPRDTVNEEEAKSPASPRLSRKSTFSKPGEHLDPTIAASMSRATQALLTIFYQLDSRKLRTVDFIRMIDSDGNGSCSPGELRRGLDAQLGFRCNNDEFKELVSAVSRDAGENIFAKDLDRAMKKAARGEDVLIQEEEAEILDDAMLQVDTAFGLPSTSASEGMYVARARWKGEEAKGPKTDPRPGRMSGPASEDSAIRQQLKLVGKRNVNVAILSILRRASGAEDELIGSSEMDVHDTKHHEVHMVELLDEKGAATGARVRLRVKLKTQTQQMDLRRQASQASLARSDSRADLPGSPRSLQSPRGKEKDPEENQKRRDLLHSLHAEKQKKLEDRRRRQEEEERLRLQEEAQKLRSKSVKAADLCPKAAAERLYRDSKAQLRRRRQHQLKHYAKEEEDMAKSKEERSRFMSKSHSEAAAHMVDDVSAGKRLHDMAISRQMRLNEKIKRKDEDEVAQAKKDAERTSMKRSSSEGAIVKDRLYQQAISVQMQKSKEREMKEQKDKEDFHKKVVGHGKQLTPEEAEKRFEELHNQYKIREAERNKARAQQRKMEDERINREIAEGRKVARQNLIKRKATSTNHVPWHERLAPPPKDIQVGALAQLRDDSLADKGFLKGRWVQVVAPSGDGHFRVALGDTGVQVDVKRQCLKQDQAAENQPTLKKALPKATTADFVLDTVLTSLRLRCAARLPPDKKVLCEPLKKVMDQYKEALAQCTKIEGFSSLASRPSLRLYPDGHLVPDALGWETVGEPGPIRQVQDDLEQLHVTAEKAQAILETRIAPKDQAWRPGELRHKPGGVPMASFAYSHGVKSMEAARTKAMVHYGPTEGERRHRHVLDLARVGLVFQNCDFLQDGLELLLSQFEVVDVRNFFRNPTRSGERLVEVLLILEVETEDGPLPHVCEVRLEEINFYNARVRVEPLMQDLLSKIHKHYSNKHPGCMEHLCRWVLDSPSTSHRLRALRKHLGRRFGSTIGAWRRRFGLNRLVPFSKFRDLCTELKCRNHATEYWQELDVGHSGCISLFELDLPSICMLATFRARLMKLAGFVNDEAAPEDLWNTLVQYVQPSRSDRLVINEFVFILSRALGFTVKEATAIFDALDADGGHTFNPPGHVCLSDIKWLTKLPILVDLGAVALRPEGFNGTETIPPLRFSPLEPSPTSDLPARASPGSPTSPISPNFLQSYGDLEEKTETLRPVVPKQPETPSQEPETPSQEPETPSQEIVTPSRAVAPDPQQASPASADLESPGVHAQEEEQEEEQHEHGQQELEGSTLLVQKTVTLNHEPEVQEIDARSEGQEEEDDYYEEEEELEELDLSSWQGQQQEESVPDETF